MPPSPELLRYIAGYAALVAATRRQTGATVEAIWRALPDYRDTNIATFAEAVTPTVIGAQQRVASLTGAFLAGYESIVRGVTVAPESAPAASVADLRGIPTREVYQRPGLTVWTALSEGVPLPDAVRRGLDRAVSLAETDVQLAKTHTSRRLLTGRRDVVGFRRILTGSQSCGLCVVASTQRYRRGDLMPIHPGCDCAVGPIYGDADPGQIINPDRLTGAHDAIAARFGVSDAGGRSPVDYREALIVHEHGDIGPVLTVRGQKFTGPNDI